MRVVIGIVRVAVAAAVVVSVTATFLTARAPVNPLNFFGFFTIQSNIIAAAAELLAGIALLQRRRGPVLLRAAAITYIALTGLVYNTLLTGIAGGVALPWANQVLHVWVPVVVLLDWTLVPDRPPLPWRQIWIVVPYPLVWLAVVLVRGATDGWVPYPFLDPHIGYGTVAVYCTAITATVLLIAAIAWATSRLRLYRRRAPRTSD